MPAFQAPPGTFDVLPPASARYGALIAQFASLVERAGYGLLIGPMFEDVGVFQRVGESTDIVRKEMYDFKDKGDRHLALRPEGTAGVVRAFVQHRPTLPWKVWYAGPHFRYDRPQKGRYRQHHQLGIEALGTDDPDLDVEVIGLVDTLLRALGLERFELRLNSIGDAECRPAYRAALLAHLEAAAAAGGLCDEHREVFRANPLRILDCKKVSCRDATTDAPRIVDHLCTPCTEHFERVRAGLGDLGIAASLDTRLVRGQDYYTRTTFEFVGTSTGAAQDSLGGGGRYDGLVEDLGGPPTPGIGFGLGIERILDACDAEGVFPVPGDVLDVFVVDTTGGDAARDLTHRLRAAGVRADRAWDARSFKAQFKAADRAGARLAIVVGSDELVTGKVGLKDLRESGAPQEAVALEDIVDEVRKRLHP